MAGLAYARVEIAGGGAPYVGVVPQVTKLARARVEIAPAGFRLCPSGATERVEIAGGGVRLRVSRAAGCGVHLCAGRSRPPRSLQNNTR